MRTAAIITVAGLSTRMGDFKPLLSLNGFPMIRMTAQSALDGGAEQVVVVLGCRADAVRSAFGDVELFGNQRIDFIENPDFAEKDMLHSIKLGLRIVSADAVFVLPGDMPAVSPESFGELRSHFETVSKTVAIPCYEKRHGHPLLLHNSTFETILRFAGDGGLRTAIDPFDLNFLEIDDPGLTMDADTSEDFAALELYIRRTKGVARQIVDEILDRFGTLPHIRAHCQATATIAVRMARHLNTLGFCLDSELIRCAAALHDMVRLEDHHWRAAARELTSLGYERLSEVVGDHHEPLEEAPARFTESSIVFAADKIVQETSLVTLDERYARSVAKFPESTDIGIMIRRDLAICRELLERYERITGDDLNPDNQ